MREAIKGLITSFEVSTSALSFASEEIVEMNRKLERPEKDLDLMNKRVERSQATMAELVKARQEAKQQKVAAAKAAKDLAAEKVARGRDQERVLEAEEDLKGMYLERDSLREKENKAAQELQKLRLTHAELQTQQGFVLLIQLWRTAEVFADLPKSATDAGLHFGQ
nr:tropomyosin-like [Aegilops tauschii subsp. strangulata]